MSSKTILNVKKGWRLGAVLGGVAALAALTASQASGQPTASASGSLRLVAYSTPREAYAELIKGFNATPAGKDTSFSQSYGASGEQQRAVRAGLKADIVTFS